MQLFQLPAVYHYKLLVIYAVLPKKRTRCSDSELFLIAGHGVN